MRGSNSPPFGFRVVTACGDTVGTVESEDSDVQAGDTLVLDGIGYRVRSVITVERIAKFVDAPHHGVLEVEPL
jgi:hypothetical protein